MELNGTLFRDCQSQLLEYPYVLHNCFKPMQLEAEIRLWLEESKTVMLSNQSMPCCKYMHVWISLQTCRALFAKENERRESKTKTDKTVCRSRTHSDTTYRDTSSATVPVSIVAKGWSQHDLSLSLSLSHESISFALFLLVVAR